MSTRLIASVGVVLCAAMTSFSIYLGVIEHIYKPSSPRAAPSHVVRDGREVICLRQRPHNTTTTTKVITQVVSCSHPSLGG